MAATATAMSGDLWGTKTEQAEGLRSDVQHIGGQQDSSHGHSRTLAAASAGRVRVSGAAGSAFSEAAAGLHAGCCV